MMHAPVNKLIVTIKQKFYDSITFQSGQVIHFDPSWHPEEYVMLRATVVSVPDSIIKRHDYKGYKLDGIKPGDEILMRYDVVFAYKDQPDRDTPIYKNLIFNYNEATGRYEELWLCDVLQVFGVYRSGELQMINGFVMLDLLTEPVQSSELIIIPESCSNQTSKCKARVRHINSDKLPVRAGDTVYINPQTVMCYQINLEKFYIIKEQYLLAKTA